MTDVALALDKRAYVHATAHRVSTTRDDIIVVTVILIMGAAAILFHSRSSDFLHDDVFYADSARSLIRSGLYGINGRPETTQPPGLPALLAILFTVFGYGQALCLCAIAVCEMLAFLATYVLLQKYISKFLAAGICIVLISSPVYFSMAAAWVSPCLPFLLTTAIALLAVDRYENSATPSSRLTWGVVLATVVAASLMVASAAISLLGAIIGAIVATSLKDWRLGLSRLRLFIPILLVGLAVQGLWMHRKPAPREWPLPGYPGPYMEQLKLKSGNYPELGTAGLADFGTRIVNNVFAQSDLFAELVLRHGVNASKIFTAIIPILMVALGWAYAIWCNRGQRILEWYFAGYEFIYLLWPWNMEARFFLPIAPLACFYAWKSIEAMRLMAVAKPRLLGIVWCPLALLLGVSGWHWIYLHWPEGPGHWPDELMAPTWCLAGVFAAWMAYTGRPPFFLSSDWRARWFDTLSGPSKVVFSHSAKSASYGVVGGLLLLGVIGLRGIEIDHKPLVSLRIGDSVSPAIGSDENPRFLNAVAPEVESAIWIRSHTPVTSTVMARHVPTVYHYAERRVVWFAPTSNADILVQGILRNKVDYVIVIKHDHPYYLPDDDYCFSRVLVNHSASFQVVFQDSHLQIFHVDRNLKAMTAVRVGLDSR